MLQQKNPDDFVLATGNTHSVKEFIEIVFSKLEIPLTWKGKGINEVAINSNSGKTVIQIDPYYFRPTEVDILVGDASKANKVLVGSQNLALWINRI